MHHGLAQVFGTGFATPMALHNRASGAVILHQSRIVDGNIGRALFEVCHGVTPCGHHAVDQRIGFVDG